jgi:hypothetical protein
MDKKLNEYFESIGMGNVLISRISEFHDQFVAIAEEAIEDAFVSEYITEDGQRQYSSVLFFTKTYVYEIESFLSDTTNLWITKLTKNLACVGFTPKDYDFNKESPASRLNLKTHWMHGSKFMLDIKASGNNCKHLLELARKYFIPNIVE